MTTSGPAPEVKRLATTCASQILSSPPARRRREQRTNWIGDFANRIRGPRKPVLGEFETIYRAIRCPSGRSPTGRSRHRRGARGGRTVGITHVVANQSPPRHRAGGAQRQLNPPGAPFSVFRLSANVNRSLMICTHPLLIVSRTNGRNSPPPPRRRHSAALRRAGGCGSGASTGAA